MFVMQFGIRICLYTENPGTDPDPDADPVGKTWKYIICFIVFTVFDLMRYFLISSCFRPFFGAFSTMFLSPDSKRSPMMRIRIHIAENVHACRQLKKRKLGCQV